MAWSVAKEQMLQKANHKDTPPALAEERRKAANHRALVDVWGEGFKRDKNGKPIEQGRGAAGNMTRESVDAYIVEQTVRRAGGPEPNYEQHLARMKRELALCEAERAKQRAAAGHVDED